MLNTMDDVHIHLTFSPFYYTMNMVHFCLLYLEEIMDNKDSLKALVNKTTFSKKQKTAIIVSFCIAVPICAILLILGDFFVVRNLFVEFACCWGAAIAVFAVLCIVVFLIKNKAAYCKKLDSSNDCVVKSQIKLETNNIQDKKDMETFADCVGTYIDTYSKNEMLCTIIKNYVASNSISLCLLEYAFLPLKLIKSSIDGSSKIVVLPNTTYKEKSINNESDYSKMMCRYNSSSLNENQTSARTAYYIRDNIFVDESKTIIAPADDVVFFSRIYELYIAVQHQNIIPKTDDKLSYYAFLFLVYMAEKHLTGNKTIEQLDNYCLSIDDDDLYIIERLHESDVEDVSITSIMIGVNSIRNDCCDFLSDEIKRIITDVDSALKNIIEKEKIERLKDPNYNLKKQSRIIISDIDLMSGQEFEQFVSSLFNELGYETSVTKTSGDQGIDIIAKKGNDVVAIQTKCYSKPVGNHAIMEAVAGAKYYNATKTMVITNNVFTKSARELAQVNNVVLWDRTVLKEKINEINA